MTRSSTHAVVAAGSLSSASTESYICSCTAKTEMQTVCTSAASGHKQLSLSFSPAGTQQCFGLQSDSQQVAHPGALAVG